MYTIVAWVYPITARILTSIIVVIITEISKQLLFYSMILPLAFIDIEVARGPFGGIIKAILFALSRNIVKYVVIMLDRKSVHENRKAQVENERLNCESKSELQKETSVASKNSDGEERNQAALEVVYEDEIMDLSYYGRLILALGGQGVPGWIFIIRTESPLQFWIAAAGSLLIEASVVVSYKNLLVWWEKRKQKAAKAAEKEKEQQKQRSAKKGTCAGRRGSVLPENPSPSRKNTEIAKISVLIDNKISQNRRLSVLDSTPVASPSMMKSLTMEDPFAMRRVRSSMKLDDFNAKTKAAINSIALAAFHQDNRRAAVERRFDMCSRYASIIGAGAVYLISMSGSERQELCAVYGLVPWETVLWRTAAILAIQFLVDWWFTVSQNLWGIPFAFTTQIEIPWIQGFVMAAFSIVQSMTVLMAHERGLFGSCQV